MRTVLLSVLAVATVVGFSMAPAWAASDFDKFRGRVGKSAQNGTGVIIDVTPNVVCVCRVGANINRAGALQSFVVPAGGGVDVLELSCVVLGFNASGGMVSTDPCPTWELLPK